MKYNEEVGVEGALDTRRKWNVISRFHFGDSEHRHYETPARE